MRCFYGDIPPTLLITGNPQQVKDYVKERIDTFCDTGVLIIEGAPWKAFPYRPSRKM